MPWTTPITWVDATIYTDVDFNAQIRDNLLLLKTSIGNDGRFLGLSSAYLANLSGTNLTGVGLLASANTWTNRFDLLTGRLVVPVEVSYGGTDNGDLSVVGQYLYWRNNAGNKQKYLGIDTGNAPAGAIAGSVWIETDGNVHYIDSVGEERYIVGSTTSLHSDVAARGGSMWMEDFLYWIGYPQEYQGHGDSHSDTAHSDSHSDVAHVDTHSDSHTDSHTDVAHVDSAHVDSHSDVAHGDSHQDAGVNTHVDMHTDTAHTDSHSDTAHSDSAHNDSHSDVAHSDTHTDTHTDTHSDTAHSDTHTDQPTAG